LVFKNQKTAHENRGCVFFFWNFSLSGAVAVFEVRLWYYRKNSGCILKKSGCLIYRNFTGAIFSNAVNRGFQKMTPCTVLYGGYKIDYFSHPVERADSQPEPQIESIT
jgi:hypothetical protein